MTLTETLGAFAAGLTFADLPEVVRRQHELHVFDSIGAALAGSAVPETLDVRDLVAASYGAGPALAIGAPQRTSVPAAALLGPFRRAAARSTIFICAAASRPDR